MLRFPNRRHGDVASHDDEVVLAPIPTDHEVVQDRLALEPVPLDQGDRLHLIRCHLRHDPFDTKIWRYGEDLLAQQEWGTPLCIDLWKFGG